MPDNVAADEIEVRIKSRVVGMLNTGCDYGNNTETLIVSGTGAAQLLFQVHSEEDCPLETTDFHLPQDEVLRMLNELLATQFEYLDSEYSQRTHLIIEPDGTFSQLISITTHGIDITVTLGLGEYQHSVRYYHGAQVPGLIDWARHWKSALEKRANFRWHRPEVETR